MPLIQELMDVHASKQLLRARDELINKAVLILGDLVPRASIMRGRGGSIQIDLRKEHQSDEHERVEVQDELIDKLQQAMGDKQRVTRFDYAESSHGVRKSKSKLKIGLEGSQTKLFAFELEWLEPAHTGVAKNEEGEKLSGEGNEELLTNMLDGHDGDVLFKDKHGNKLFIKGVKVSKHVGGEHNLTDVRLETEDGEVNLSIKKMQFREVRSAAALLKDTPEYLDFMGIALDDLVGSGNVAVSKMTTSWGDEYYGFDHDKHHEVAIEIDDADKQAVYFKDGETAVDAVIVQSFTPANFKVKDDVLEVACSFVLLPGDVIPPHMTPFLRGKVDTSKGVKRTIILDGQKVSLKLEIVPRFQLGRYKRHHIDTKQELPARTHIVKI